MTEPDGEVVGVHGVSVIRSGNLLLDDIEWRVHNGERWVLLGPNGSGKTTLISVAATYLWPSRGSVSVLGRAVGAVDVRELRRRIGIVSASLEARIPTGLTALDVVVAGATGAIAPWWDRPAMATRDRAVELLGVVGCAALLDRLMLDENFVSALSKHFHAGGRQSHAPFKRTPFSWYSNIHRASDFSLPSFRQAS